MKRTTKNGIPTESKIDPEIGRRNTIINRFKSVSSIGDKSTYLNVLFTEPIGTKDKISPIVLGRVRQITENNTKGGITKFFIENKPALFGTIPTRASDLTDDEKATIIRTIIYMNKIGFNVVW